MGSFKTIFILLLTIWLVFGADPSDVAPSKPKKVQKPKEPQKPKDLKSIVELLKSFDIDLKTFFVNPKTDLNNTACNEAIGHMFKELGKEDQYWGAFMLDSMGGRIPGQLSGARIQYGNYKQCITTIVPKMFNFTPQYCLLSYSGVKKNQIDYKEIGLRKQLNPEKYRGLCLPSVCDREYIIRVLRSLEFPMAKTKMKNEYSLDIEPWNCYKQNEEKPYTLLNNLTEYVMWILGAIVIMSTAYDITVKKDRKELLTAFSAAKHGLVFLMGEETDRVASLNGLRAFMVLSTIYCYQYIVTSTGNMANVTELGVLKAWNMVLYKNSFLAFDSLLFMAATFSAYSFFKKLNTNAAFNPLAEIIRRYIKVLVPLCILLLIRIGYMEQIHEGSIYNEYVWRQRANCNSTLTTQLLSVDNFFTNIDNMCFQHLWYTDLVTQLVLLSQFVYLAVLWSKKAVIWTSLALSVCITANNSYAAYAYGVGPNFVLDRSWDSFEIKPIGLPHYSGAIWFAGIVFGYFLQGSENKPFRVSKLTQAFLWISTGSLMSALFVSVGYFDYYTYDQFSVAIYAAARTIILSLFLSWIIYALWHNSASWLSFLLSPLSYLGSISFEMYLLGVPTLEFIVAASTEAYYYDEYRIFYHTAATVGFTMMAASLLALTVTRPIQFILNHTLSHMKLGTVRIEEPKKTQ